MWVFENCKIRRATSEDLENIEIFLESLSDLEKSYLSDNVFKENTEVLLAEIGEEIVGIAIIQYSPEPRKRHIAHLLIAVKEELRGMGIGYNLNKVCEEVVKDRNVLKLKIEAPVFNIYTISRSEIWGYQREAYLSKEFYINGKLYDIVVLSRFLQQ